MKDYVGLCIQSNRFLRCFFLHADGQGHTEQPNGTGGSAEQVEGMQHQKSGLLALCSSLERQKFLMGQIAGLQHNLAQATTRLGLLPAF